MRACFVILLGVASTLVCAQSVTSVYKRDTHEAFRLKNMRVESTVVGPIVKTSTWLTYDNPYKALTEATLNFEMPGSAALGGFAYLYGDEYVRGRLMDKNKAWFIYTAITSRGRDPGIMEQWSPTTYHCQIFPIKMGRDLRIRLWSVGMLQPQEGTMNLPKPTAPRAVGYQATDPTLVEPIWTSRSVQSPPIVEQDGRYTVNLPSGVSAVAQKFKDGRIYVAGFIRTPQDNDGKKHKIVVKSAFYEPVNGDRGGADVTAKVQELIDRGDYAFNANNAVFGDPTPYKLKRLSMSFEIDGQAQTEIVPENTSVALIKNVAVGGNTTFFKLRQPKTVVMDPQTLAFSGWLLRNETMAARFNGTRYAFKPKLIASGGDTARIWAQQMLATNRWQRAKDVLAFSMKYGVPSTATALLAVPEEEMKLFAEKEKEFQKMQAEQRKRELEVERQQRNWAGGRGGRQQNWTSSGGGDPEIRVTFHDAKSVDAILPDRRVLQLTAEGDVWGGNFEIPADALEGTYIVRVVATLRDGSRVERSWNYEVDRTPPHGKADILFIGSKPVLEVRSEKGLNEVAAFSTDGRKWILVEVRPGVYRVELPLGFNGSLTIVLKDRAGNKGQVQCSRPHS